LIVNWTCDTANVYDGAAFQNLVDDLADDMVIFSDMAFAKQDWYPTNLRLCKKGEWNVRMLVETVLSMLTYICDFKRSRHKAISVISNVLATKFGTISRPKSVLPWLYSIFWCNGTVLNMMIADLSRFLSLNSACN
jgi:hypothetical protein